MAATRNLSGICVITAGTLSHLDAHLEIARAAVEAGARMVQLREKNATTRELFKLAADIRRLTAETETLFLVNDRVDVALAVDADGAHVGPDDLPWQKTRQLLREKILGVSAATPEEVAEAEAAKADYLGVGPAFGTGSKADAGEAIGPEGVVRIAQMTSLPVLAIGGINAENAGLLRETGAAGIAVISAVAGAEDKSQAIRDLQAIWR